MTDVAAVSTPTRRERLLAFLEHMGLQAGHRLGAAAILLLLGCLAARWADREYRSLLLLSFAAADLGFVGGLVAWRAARSLGHHTREAASVVVVNAVPLLPTAVWIAYSIVVAR
jgi:hypothetical protein